MSTRRRSSEPPARSMARRVYQVKCRRAQLLGLSTRFAHGVAADRSAVARRHHLAHGTTCAAPPAVFSSSGGPPAGRGTTCGGGCSRRSQLAVAPNSIDVAKIPRIRLSWRHAARRRGVPGCSGSRWRRRQIVPPVHSSTKSPMAQATNRSAGTLVYQVTDVYQFESHRRGCPDGGFSCPNLDHD